MLQPTRRLVYVPLLSVATLVSALGLSSCAGFFVCQKASCPTSTTSTSTSTNDLAYVANSATGSTYINGYAVSSGTLVAATNSPYSIGYVPSAIAVTTADTFVYVASDPVLTGSNYIYGYTIGTGGALTNGSAQVAENSVALAVSPDGRFLFSLNADGLTMEQYSINTSTGALTSIISYPLTGSASGGTLVPYNLTFAPSGDFLVATYGLAGAQVFSYSYNTSNSTSTVTSTAILNPRNSTDAYYAVAIDSSNYIYLASSAGLDVYSTTTAGVPALVNTTPYAAGSGARAVALNAAGNYVYVADSVGSQIYGYSIGTGGGLTALSGSPFTAPPGVAALARDNSGDYLLAEGYSSVSGIQIFGIGSSGALTSNNTAGSGTSTADPVVLATTH
jgi:6-phosphogluconolactonase (cycloisomerase 2 family)